MRASNISISMILIAAALSFASADEAGAKNRKANKLYSKGQYEEALKLYDDAILLDPSNGKLKMNRGSALYGLGEFDEAEKSYQDAVSSPLDKKATADAHYNLGNIQYKQAEKLESVGDVSSAQKKYGGAVESYVNALKLRPKDMDAKWNLQLAHQKIDVLKDRQDKNQDENKDQDKQQDGDRQKDKQRGDDDKDQKDKDRQDKDRQNDKDQSDNKDQQDQDNNDQQGDNNQQRRQPDKGDRKKEEAERLIEQYADDSDTLNKPKFQRVKIKQPEKDW